MAGDFDKIVRLIRDQDTPVSTTVISTQIDFDLSLGFIIKLKTVHSYPYLLTLTDTDNILLGLDMALLRNPNDTSTTSANLNNQNDLLVGFTHALLNLFTTSGQQSVRFPPQQVSFSEDLDVISARNLRHNAAGFNSNGSITETLNIYYILEEVKEARLRDLLQIV